MIAKHFIAEFEKLAFMSRNSGGDANDLSIDRQVAPDYEALESKNLGADIDGTYLDLPWAERKAEIQGKKREALSDGTEPDTRDTQSRMSDTANGGKIT